MILLFYGSGHLQDTLQKWYVFCGVMCHFQLPSISIFSRASDEKHFVRDLTTFDICAHVNSFFHVFRQETRRKLCKWNIFFLDFNGMNDHQTVDNVQPGLLGSTFYSHY